MLNNLNTFRQIFSKYGSFFPKNECLYNVQVAQCVALWSENKGDQQGSLCHHSEAPLDQPEPVQLAVLCGTGNGCPSLAQGALVMSAVQSSGKRISMLVAQNNIPFHKKSNRKDFL